MGLGKSNPNHIQEQIVDPLYWWCCKMHWISTPVHQLAHNLSTGWHLICLLLIGCQSMYLYLERLVLWIDVSQNLHHRIHLSDLDLPLGWLVQLEASH